MSVILYEGDCLHVLKQIESQSIDSIVTDPPYGLTFMGKKWDYDVPSTQIWTEVLRVLKPGGQLLSFSGTRTYHRMVVAIEDAGFEIRDQIGWLYGSGFPKSRNLDGEWEGWGTALKPAWEPICMARKPFAGTVAANVLEHGVGALNIDACRILTEDVLNGGAYSHGGRSALPGDTRTGAAAGMFVDGGGRLPGAYKQPDGRWPANVIHDGSDEVLSRFPSSGNGNGKGGFSYAGREYNNAATSMFNGDKPQAPSNYNDKGSAARFFYCAKASKADRQGSKHPTVKPVALMRYLCRLVTSKGGTILDPFAGSGTTGQAAVEEGFNAVLIEREAEYCEDIRHRLAL